MVIQISDTTFKDEVLLASLPVLVDFWAPWCGPCKMLSPVLEEFAKEVAGEVIVAKMNVDDNPIVPGNHSVRSIPSLFLFHKGAVLGSQSGFITKDVLSKWVKDLLATSA